MIMEKAYAKLNLTLSVLGKRADGFHELESIMVPVIDLYDELYFEENETDEMILIDNFIENNSILRAAKAFQEKYKTKGAKIRLNKRIPLEAGLAGGSADSSATLRGLNHLFNLNIPLSELEELASMLGSDNVFCLYDEAAICKGRGEQLTFINTDFSFNVYIVKPPFGLKTPEVFRNLELNDTNKNSYDGVLKALNLNDYDLLNEEIYNDLLPAALKVENQLSDFINTLGKCGCKVFMSGSGSALYIVSEKNIDIKIKENVYIGKHIIKNTVKD